MMTHEFVPIIVIKLVFYRTYKTEPLYTITIINYYLLPSSESFYHFLEMIHNILIS